MFKINATTFLALILGFCLAWVFSGAWMRSKIHNDFNAITAGIVAGFNNSYLLSECTSVECEFKAYEKATEEAIKIYLGH
jgi:uncharacterized membrane protein (DUF485 family)